MANYLYGISVQGIQSFIFQTNKLKEIVGASNWIEEFCTSTETISSTFKAALGDSYNKDNLLLGAAGNIKYVFDKEEDCKKIVRNFIHSLRQEIPDLSISQAVVALEDRTSPNETDLLLLNSRLDAQRSKGVPQHALGLMISERARRTGKPGVIEDLQAEAINGRKPYLDRTQALFQKKEFEQKEKPKTERTDRLKEKIEFRKEIEFIDEFPKDKQTWVAVVHADGNNLGKTIRTLLANNRDNTKEVLAGFSKDLTKATQKAARTAYQQLFGTNPASPVFFRPIVLGGDDFTFIIQGDYALKFTASFLKEFEKNTEILGKKYDVDKLTACAGIAYIKTTYPFHYGAHLAEKLAKHAKDIAKDIAKAKKLDHVPSCLAFHKVHSSFVEDYGTIIKRELTVEDLDIRFDFGPYFIHETDDKYATTQQLEAWVAAMREEEAPSGNIRNWLSALHESEGQAQEIWRRMTRMNNFNHYKSKLSLEVPKRGEKTHLYDVLSLASINQLKQAEDVA